MATMPCDDCVHLSTRHADPARKVVGKCFWSGPIPGWVPVNDIQPLIHRGQAGLEWCPAQKPKGQRL